MNGTNLPPSYPHTSSLFAQVFEPVSQAGNDVSQNVTHDPDRVSQPVTQPPNCVIHDATQTALVSHNPQDPQLNPCDTSCITNAEPCITQPKTKYPKFNHYPLADRMQIRKDWIKGLGTLTSLAKKYEIPVATVKTWHYADGWKAGRARWRAHQMEDDFNSQPIAPKPAPPPPATPLSPFLERITKQIECLDNLLDNAKTPEDWQKLTNSKDKLLQNFYVLAGIAKPAARKAAKTSVQRAIPIEPVEPGNV